MVFAFASGHRLDDSLRYGVAAGTAALLWPGTELCHRADVERLLPEVAVEELAEAVP
jgi:6-phosphofructokinase 2